MPLEFPPMPQLEDFHDDYLGFRYREALAAWERVCQCITDANLRVALELSKIPERIK